jgi:MoaA/NifB/PqqE/SkfB family radical SAM enzyme
MYITIITNGTCIDRRLALNYKNMPVSFMLKLNSLKKDVQDSLIGRSSMAENIYRAIDILIESGFTGYPKTRLAIDALICQQTIDEIPDIVRFALKRRIFPVVERLLAAGRGLANRSSLEVDELSAALVLQKVQGIMGIREKNAFSGCDCDLHDYTMFVDVDGMVTKCVGGQREVLLGDCRTEALAVIWDRQLSTNKDDGIVFPKETGCLQTVKCPGRNYCEVRNGIVTHK